MAKPKLTSRSVAAQVLARVLGGQSLSQALPDASDKLQDADVPLMRQLCYGSCRQYQYLSAILPKLLKKPLKKKDADIQALLLIGIYQLKFSRVPAYAALAETVAASKVLRKDWARGLVNAVLRNFQREQEKLEQQIPADARSWVTPPWLLKRVRKAWPQHWQQIAASMAQQPPMILRVSQRHTTATKYIERLAEEGIKASLLDSVPSAIKLEKAVDVLLLPGFYDGVVSVQDAGAQMAAPALLLEDGQRVLDVCAAPGGKTGHILELADVMLTAVDSEANRLLRVQENLQRLKLDAQIEVADASKQEGDWSQTRYDRILLDVPCSATGVIRRNPDIMMLRRNSDIETLVTLQRSILHNAWALLKPGGILLYVTCSVLPDENSQQIKAFLDRMADAKLDDIALSGSVDVGLGRQLLPTSDNDSFYYARLIKVAQ